MIDCGYIGRTLHRLRSCALQKFNGSDFSVRLPMVGVFNQRIIKFRPHIIHSHHPFLLGDTALRFAASQQAPIVFTHHTLYERYTHYVPFDSAAIKQFVIQLSTDYANLCQAVIAPSESIARLIRKRGVVTPIHVIPTGIDVSSFAGGDRHAFRKAHRIPARTFVVGHVGRLAPEKNLKYLAAAVAAFIKSTPQTLFLVVGAGPSEKAVQAAFARAGISERLLMAGKKTGSDLHAAYRAMDLFAFSSQSETQGMVVAEAMAAHLPVVALDASGVREVVEDGSNGFLLESSAPVAEFVRHLKKIKADPALRRRLIAGAVRTAKLYTRERCAQTVLDLYQQLLAEKQEALAANATEPWTSLLDRIEVEWRLISDKAGAAFNALLAEDKDIATSS